MKKILVIEDDVFISEVIASILNDSGYDVLERDDLQFLDDPEIEADLILLDLWINDLDGREVYKQIQNHERLRNSKVILISAAADILSIANEIDLPYIKKPFDIDDLTDKVKKILS